MKKILFSGIQPSGELHIGNYLGAMKQWVELQNSGNYQPLFCVVDLHSLTQDYDPQKKQEQIFKTAVDFLACGLDPKKSIIFVQSQVSEHAELAWFFNCLTPVGELKRMTQFKDKTDISSLHGQERIILENLTKLKVKIGDFEDYIENFLEELKKKRKQKLTNMVIDDLVKKLAVRHKYKEIKEGVFEILAKNTDFTLRQDELLNKANVGLFDYPVLMAADILLYQTEIVPVGEDQVQHVELARVIARKFNNKFGEFFPEPKTKLVAAKRIMALNEPDKKMSKSLGAKAYIALTDAPAMIREKIKVAVTTPEGAKNLLELLGFFSPDKKLVAKFAKEFSAGTIKYSELKPALAEAMIEVLRPIQEKQKYYLTNPKKVAKILATGAQQAQELARKNLQAIKQRMGLL